MIDKIKNFYLGKFYPAFFTTLAVFYLPVIVFGKFFEVTWWDHIQSLGMAFAIGQSASIPDKYGKQYYSLDKWNSIKDQINSLEGFRVVKDEDNHIRWTKAKEHWYQSDPAIRLKRKKHYLVLNAPNTILAGLPVVKAW